MESIDCINRLLGLYTKTKPAHEVFDDLLTDILKLTDSQFGFIFELKHDDKEVQYLQALAISNICWDDASRRFWDENYSTGLKFYGTDALYFAAVTTKAPIIANDPTHDSHSSHRMPHGHPHLAAFLGLPIFCEGEIIGALGLANRPGGYDEKLITSLKTVLNACAQVLEGYRNEMRRLDAEMALQEKSTLLENIINSSSDYILAKDANLKAILCNNNFAYAMGKSPNDLYGKTDHENGIANYKFSDAHADQKVLNGQIINDVNSIYNVDGICRSFESIKLPLRSSDNKIIGTLELNRDITEKKAMEEKLKLAASVFTSTLEGIMILSSEGTILETNTAFSRITGFKPEEILGKNMQVLSAGINDSNFFKNLWYNLNTKGHWYGEVWNRRKNGEVYAVMQSINSISDETHTNPKKFVSLLSDITMIKEHEKSLEHIAHYDALTSLPNRVLLTDRLHQNLIQARRREQPLALVYIDLDGFKSVNDNYGHEAGDNLLITVSQRMKKALREGDTLARIGGDEFVAILLDIGDRIACEPILNRVRSAAAELVYFSHNHLQVSASLGVTFFAHTEEISVNKLLLEADQAMYQAKFEGKNCFHFYNAVKDRYINSYTETLERITQALISHEFVMYYQPKVNMHTGTIIGAEALVRWQHPEKGLLLPDIFLPVIKDQSLSTELGVWIIEAVFEQMEIWHSTGLAIPVSINLDSRQLQQTGFMDNLRAQLNAHPTVNPEFLELEVLESSMMEDIIKVSNIIEACNDMNIKCSLDNFGTGYSSLSYLNRLPPTMIKIDRTVVLNMLNNVNERTIVKCIIGLAKTIGLKVMAVGVESIEHGTMLRQLGCDLMQGNIIAHPMMANEFTNWCSSWKPDPVKTITPPISTLV